MIVVGRSDDVHVISNDHLRRSKTPNRGGFVVWPRTVGEKSAILYDNPKYDIHGHGDSSASDGSHGYFGLQSLSLVKPPNARHIILSDLFYLEGAKVR